MPAFTLIFAQLSEHLPDILFDLSVYDLSPVFRCKYDTINACRDQQDTSYDIQDPNCFCTHDFFLFSFEALFELLFVFMPLVYSFSAKKQETGSTRNVYLIVRKAQIISQKKTA